MQLWTGTKEDRHAKVDFGMKILPKRGKELSYFENISS
jgi:hypothetical protein